MKHITQVLLTLVLFCVTTLSWAQPADQAISHREFLQSLTSAERKLPTDLVVATRYAAGQPLPLSLEARAAAQARSAAEADDLPDSVGVLTRCLARNDASEAVSDQRNFSIFTAM